MAKQKQKTRRLKNQGTQVKANQNYKDTVFRKLFSAKRIYCHFIMQSVKIIMKIRKYCK